MRVGLFDHFGWAVAVTASDDHQVVDRRRIELIGPGLSEAPIHYDRGQSSDEAVLAMIAEARASIARTTSAAFDELPSGIVSVSLRTWPPDLPDDITVLRQPPWESRADAVMYRQVIAEVARARGWEVHLYDAKAVLAQAGELGRPPGPPWTKEHRIALAATVVAATTSPGTSA